MPLRHISKNKILLQKHFNLQEPSIDKWPFWMLEENVKIINEIIEEEDKTRSEQEKKQSGSMGNFNADSMMKNASNLTNNFKPPSF